MSRFFSKRQKTLLKVISGNACSICKKFLGNDFHADHIKPYAKNGQTITNNGQSLCQQCNLKKGSCYDAN